MKGKLGGLWLPKGIIRSMGNRLHQISVLDTGFVSLLITSKSLQPDPRISNRGSLLEKRASRIHGQPYLYSPLPFPDSGRVLCGIEAGLPCEADLGAVIK